MKRDIVIDNLKPRHFFWILAFILAIFFATGVFLYWQKALSLGNLILGALGLVAVGFLFILGVRIGQRDAFVDGFRNARDKMNQTKKKS